MDLRDYAVRGLPPVEDKEIEGPAYRIQLELWEDRYGYHHVRGRCQPTGKCVEMVSPVPGRRSFAESLGVIHRVMDMVESTEAESPRKQS